MKRLRDLLVNTFVLFVFLVLTLQLAHAESASSTTTAQRFYHAGPYSCIQVPSQITTAVAITNKTGKPCYLLIWTHFFPDDFQVVTVTSQQTATIIDMQVVTDTELATVLVVSDGLPVDVDVQYELINSKGDVVQ